MPLGEGQGDLKHGPVGISPFTTKRWSLSSAQAPCSLSDILLTHSPIHQMYQAPTMFRTLCQALYVFTAK